jgi:hypothetical protein
LVWKGLREVVTHPEDITEALERAHGGHWLPKELKARRRNLREGDADLKRQLERLTDAYPGEVTSLAEYERRRRDLRQKDGSLAGQERQLETRVDQRIELAGLAGSVEEFCERMRSALASATFEQRRELVKLLVDRVIVTDEAVEIRYVLPTSPESEHIRFCHLRSDYPYYPAAGQDLEASRREQPLPVDLPTFLYPLLRPGPCDLLRGSASGYDASAQRSALVRFQLDPCPKLGNQRRAASEKGVAVETARILAAALARPGRAPWRGGP